MADITDQDIAIAEAEAAARLRLGFGIGFTGANTPGVEPLPDVPMGDTPSPMSQGIGRIGLATADFLAPGIKDALSAQGSLTGAQMGGVVADILPVPGKGLIKPILKAGAGALGYYAGDTIAQGIEEATRDMASEDVKELLDYSEPGIQPPGFFEASLGSAAVRGSDFLMRNLAALGKKKANLATSQYRRAGEASARNLRELLYDEVAEEFRPALDQSVDVAMATGAFDGVGSPETILKSIRDKRAEISGQLFGTKEAPGLIPAASKKLGTEDIQIELENVRRKLLQKHLKQDTELLPNAKNQIRYEKQREEYIDFLTEEARANENIQTLRGLQEHKRAMQQDVNWKDKTSTTKNLWKKEYQHELGDAIENLVSKALGDEAGAEVGSLNAKLGALIETDEKIFAPAVSKLGKGARITWGKAAMMTGALAAPAGVAAFGGDPTIPAAALGMMGGAVYSTSPSGLIERAKGNRILGSALTGAAKLQRGFIDMLTSGATIAPEAQAKLVNDILVRTQNAEVARAADAIFKDGDPDRIGRFLTDLIAQDANAEGVSSMFEPAPYGYKSYFGSKLYDELERNDYASKLRAQETSDNMLEITKELNALNKDGTIINKERFEARRRGVAKRGMQTYELSVPIEAPETASTSSTIANSVRQDYDY